MSSHRSSNRHVGKPPNTANIRTPDAMPGMVDTDIPQPEHPEGVRLAGRRRHDWDDGLTPIAAATNLRAVARMHGVDVAPSDIPRVGVKNANTLPGNIATITRGDVELFFDAAHAFRTSLAGALPEIAQKLGKFILATPYTLIDSKGHPIQMIPDAAGMTATQVKLAGLILHRLLPPLTDMDIEGRTGPGKGTHVDARQVKITVNTVTAADGDPTDAKLRSGRRESAARQVSPITMNLGEVVEKALAGGDAGVTLPSEPEEHLKPEESDAPAGAERENADEPDQRDPPPAVDADRN